MLVGRLQIADESTRWRDLPQWSRFFVHLGEHVARAQEAGVKTCAVVIPPVRSFAAVFVAAGAVVETARSAQAVPEIDEHFDYLASLEKETRVVVKMGDRIYAAGLRGVVRRDGITYLRVEYDGMTHYLPKQECQRVQVGEGGRRELPRAPRRSGPRISTVVEELLGEYAGDFLSVPTVDTVLVGKASQLQQELECVRIRASDGSGATATLAALLRPRRFLPDGGISRSLLVSERVTEFSMPVEDVPHVAVLDGPRAFARRRAEFGESSWVAVLDRCSASFGEGLDVANEEFAVRCGPAPYFTELDVPPGTEVHAFERGR